MRHMKKIHTGTTINDINQDQTTARYHQETGRIVHL